MRRLEPEEIENQNFPITRRGYEKEKVDAFLRVVAEFYRGALRAAESETRAPAPAPSAPVPTPRAAEPPASRRSFDQLGDQIAAVLGTAEQAATELKLTAERDAQHMRRAAAEEAAETTQAATNQLALARQLKANAQQEAEASLADARDESTRLKQEAHVIAARLEQNARERAAKVEQAADARLEEVVVEARRRYEQLSSASQQSIDHILSVEAVLRHAREELTVERLTTKEAEFPDEPAGLAAGATAGDGVAPERRGSDRADSTGDKPGPVEIDLETEAILVAPEGEPAFTAVASFTDDAVDESARQAEEKPEPRTIKPAPSRRKSTGAGTRTRSASRRAGSRSVPSSNATTPPDQN